jgi:cytochrome c-type biogenesis protein CcmE
MKKQTERFWIVMGSLLAMTGLVIWLTQVFRQNMLFFVKPSELNEMVFNKTVPKDTSNQNLTHPENFRLGGLVAPYSVTRNGLFLEFDVTDETGVRQRVNFKGIPPELFAENKGVIAEGKMVGSIFEAKRILAKHDETYAPPKMQK